MGGGVFAEYGKSDASSSKPSDHARTHEVSRICPPGIE